VRLAGVKLPLPVSEATVDVLLGGLIFAFALIKNLTNDYSTWASYVGVGLALLIFGGAWMELRAAADRPSSSTDSASKPRETETAGTGIGEGATGEGGEATGDAALDLTGRPSGGADA
jgi:protein-S-isoprenylcysteine O-methyltransferase Ste14